MDSITVNPTNLNGVITSIDANNHEILKRLMGDLKSYEILKNLIYEEFNNIMGFFNIYSDTKIAKGLNQIEFKSRLGNSNFIALKKRLMTLYQNILKILNTSVGDYKFKKDLVRINSSIRKIIDCLETDSKQIHIIPLEENFKKEVANLLKDLDRIERNILSEEKDFTRRFDLDKAA